MFLSLIQQYPFIIAFLCGLVPALVWLFFWIKEDTHPEPPKMITLSFVGGMVAVLLVIPFQKVMYEWFIQNPHPFLLTIENMLPTKQGLHAFAYIAWAALEETWKFIVVYIIALRYKKITDEPIDDLIYLIISAIGFAAMENTLYIANYMRQGDFLESVINLNLRFIGASLLHIISSASIGVWMAISFYKHTSTKIIYLICGLITATILHAIFNLVIISEAVTSVLPVFGGVWVAIIILLLIFEKIKNITRT